MNTTPHMYRLLFSIGIILIASLPAHASSNSSSAAPWPKELGAKEQKSAALQALHKSSSSPSAAAAQQQRASTQSRTEFTPPKINLLRSALMEHPTMEQLPIVPFRNNNGKLLPEELQDKIFESLSDTQQVNIEQGYTAQQANWRANSHICLSPNGQILVTAGRDTEVNAEGQTIYKPFLKVWRVVHDQVQKPYSQKKFTPDAERGIADQMTWSPNSQLFICSYIGTNDLALGHNSDCRPEFDLFVNQDNKLSAPQTVSIPQLANKLFKLSWHATGRAVAITDCSGSDLALQFFDQNNHRSGLARLGESTVGHAWNPNGSTLVTSHQQENEAYQYLLKVWATNQAGKITSKQPLQTIPVGLVYQLAFNPSGTLLAMPETCYPPSSCNDPIFTITTYLVNKQGLIDQTSKNKVVNPASIFFHFNKFFWSPCGKKIGLLTTTSTASETLLLEYNDKWCFPQHERFKDTADCAFTSQSEFITLNQQGVLTIPLAEQRRLVKSAQVTAAVIKQREHLAGVKKENAQEPLQERQRAWRRIKTHEGIEFREDQVNTK